MGITNEQWMTAAEKAAAESWGRRHEGWFVFRRFGMVPLIGAVVVGVLGWIGYKAWTLARDLWNGGGITAIPVSSLFAAGVLTFLTPALIRVRTYGVITLAKVAFLVIAWIALIAWTVGMM